MLNCLVHKHYKTLCNWTWRFALVTRFLQKMATNIRWAFKSKEWQPTYEEILAISSFIQPEEKHRISKFYFIDDAKSTLVGRLLLRKYAYESTGVPYECIRFDRNSHGKPILLNKSDYNVNFNVSHQGDYVVLAGIHDREIGVDVMKIEPPANKDVPEYFRLMQQQFSSLEWRTIKSYSNEYQQMSCFYRLWCLKESYVKNLGVGVTIPLKNISFSLKSLDMKMGDIITDTVVYKNNVFAKDWIFIESLLDDAHTVAVSIRIKEGDNIPQVGFKFLTTEDLIKDAKSFCDPDPQFAAEFIRKKIKHF